MHHAKDVPLASRVRGRQAHEKLSSEGTVSDIDAYGPTSYYMLFYGRVLVAKLPAHDHNHTILSRAVALKSLT